MAYYRIKDIVRNMSSSTAQVKMDPDSVGGGGDSDGDGDGGGGGSNGNDNTVRSGDGDSPPSDLVLVGKIVDHPAPVLERGTGGKFVRVHVDTWMQGYDQGGTSRGPIESFDYWSRERYSRTYPVCRF
eukprot:scaffold14886_cov44-Attheya_sp.AAC.1